MSDIIARRLDRGVRWAVVGLCVNLVLAGGKILAGAVGHSYALIADGVESCLDIFGSLVVMSGLRLAAVPPDADHPYGHGKAEALAGAVVAIALLGAAIALAIVSIREIFEPHHSPAPFTLVVLVSVVIIKEVLFRLIRGVGLEIGSLTVEADAWHHRSDAITSAAAFLGISVALIGGDGYEAADDWAALLACVVIASNGVRLLRPALGQIMDAAPPESIVGAIKRTAASVGGVDGLDKCRVRKTGLSYYVDLHVRVDGRITVFEGHRIAHKVKDAVRSNHPEVADVLVHVEPQADETGRSVGLGG